MLQRDPKGWPRTLEKREDSAISSQASILSAVGSYKIERPESYEGSFLADSSGHSILQPLVVGKIGEGVETRRRASSTYLTFK